MARRHHSMTKGARRATSWGFIVPTQTAIVAGGGVILNALDTAGLAKRPFTIIRSHLHIRLASDQLGADEVQFAAVGMCVVSEQASAIGVTVVPTPNTDAASDLWLLHQYISNDFTFVTGTGFDADGGTFMNVDSKAARKINDDQDLLVVAELVTGISNGLLLTVAGRFLIKEH